MRGVEESVRQPCCLLLRNRVVPGDVDCREYGGRVGLVVSSVLGRREVRIVQQVIMREVDAAGTR